MSEYQNTGWQRSLTIRIEQEVLGEPVELPIVVDGKTNTNFLAAYSYAPITNTELARMSAEDYFQRFNDLIAYIRDTYENVKIQTTTSGLNPVFVEKIPGFNNVFVESQGYRLNEGVCTPPTPPGNPYWYVLYRCFDGATFYSRAYYSVPPVFLPDERVKDGNNFVYTVASDILIEPVSNIGTIISLSETGCPPYWYKLRRCDEDPFIEYYYVGPYYGAQTYNSGERVYGATIEITYEVYGRVEELPSGAQMIDGISATGETGCPDPLPVLEYFRSIVIRYADLTPISSSDCGKQIFQFEDIIWHYVYSLFEIGPGSSSELYTDSTLTTPFDPEGEYQWAVIIGEDGVGPDPTATVTAKAWIIGNVIQNWESCI